ncbi:hypothetical protein B484DRAFT_35828, partial [Ochromonadaceae sp. CCMP2298]
HYTLYTIHYTLYTIHYTLYTIHYTLYTIHYTLYTIHYTLYTIHYHIYYIYYILYTIFYNYTTTILYTKYYTLYYTCISPHWKVCGRVRRRGSVLHAAAVQRLSRSDGQPPRPHAGHHFVRQGGRAVLGRPHLRDALLLPAAAGGDGGRLCRRTGRNILPIYRRAGVTAPSGSVFGLPAGPAVPPVGLHPLLQKVPLCLDAVPAGSAYPLVGVNKWV